MSTNNFPQEKIRNILNILNEDENPKDEKKLVAVIGRFNPPTRGHERVFNFARKVARNHKADLVVLVSRSYDRRKNPLTPYTKMRYLQKFFRNINFELFSNIYETLKEKSREYDRLILICGADRKESYRKMLDLGMSKPREDENHIDFKSYEILSLNRAMGVPSSTSVDVEYVSASGMRDAVQEDNYELFLEYAPTTNKAILKDFYEAIKLNK